MAKEVARFHAASQQAGQSHAAALSGSVLSQGKAEILRVVEHIVDKMAPSAVGHLVEVMDITMHCLEQQLLKAKGLQETFPALSKLPMVSYCSSTRRICVAACTGQLALYDAARSQRAHLVSGHHGPVAALCFSPDGRYLASYAPSDAKLFMWQTGSHSLFGISSQPAKCIKKHNAPMPANSHISRAASLKIARVVWVDAKTAVLLMADGREERYKV